MKPRPALLILSYMIYTNVAKEPNMHIETHPDTLVTTYLHMTSKDTVQAVPAMPHNVRIEKLNVVDLDFYRFMYRSVGWEWFWRDRLEMDDGELESVLSSETTSVHVLYVDNTPAGYVELNREGESVEIAYFGLRRQFFGRGLGKLLLTYGIHEAWELATERVWLHTCNLDGPHALENYKKRGFEVYGEEREVMPAIYKPQPAAA